MCYLSLSEWGESSIDLIALPWSYAESITGATVLFSSVRTLQHAKVRRTLDHDPVIVSFAYAPDMFGPPPPTRQRLDMDLVGFAMTTGYRREDFIQKLEEGAKKAAVKHPPHSSMADQKWEDVIQIVQQAADTRTTKRTNRRIENSWSLGKPLSDKDEGPGPDLWNWVSKEEEPKRGKPPKKSKRRLPGRSRNSLERHKDNVENGKLKRATLEEELVEAERAGRTAIAHKIPLRRKDS